MTNSDRNSARPTSTWFGGTLWVPIALRTSESTTTIFVNAVQSSRIAGATPSTVTSRMIVTTWLGWPGTLTLMAVGPWTRRIRGHGGRGGSGGAGSAGAVIGARTGQPKARTPRRRTRGPGRAASAAVAGGGEEQQGDRDRRAARTACWRCRRGRGSRHRRRAVRSRRPSSACCQVRGIEHGAACRGAGSRPPRRGPCRRGRSRAGRSPADGSRAAAGSRRIGARRPRAPRASSSRSSVTPCAVTPSTNARPATSTTATEASRLSPARSTTRRPAPLAADAGPAGRTRGEHARAPRRRRGERDPPEHARGRRAVHRRAPPRVTPG